MTWKQHACISVLRDLNAHSASYMKTHISLNQHTHSHTHCNILLVMSAEGRDEHTVNK